MNIPVKHMVEDSRPFSSGPDWDGPSGDLVTPDYAALLNTVSDWMWRTDEMGQILDLSASIAKITRRPAADYRGFTFASWGRFVDPCLLDLTDHEAFRWRAPFSDIAFLVSDESGETRAFSLAGTPVFSPVDGRYLGYCGTARETQAPVVEAAVAAETEPTSSARSEDVVEPEFAVDPLRQLSLLSHDIRDPLNAMLGFVQLIGDAMQETPNTQLFSAYCDDIYAAAEEMLDRLDEALDLVSLQSGAEALDLRPLDLVDQIAPCLTTVEPIARQKSVDITVTSPRDPIFVAGDFWAVRRVLVTMLVNALHNASVPGTITLDLRVDGNWARIEVRDHGKGQRPEVLDRLVAPFNQSDGAYFQDTPRVGLGMAISRLLVNAHRGRLTLTSAQGEGTIARVLLPLWHGKKG